MVVFVMIVCMIAAVIVVPVGIKERRKPGFPTTTTLLAVMIIIVALVVPTTALIVTVGNNSEYVASIDECGTHQNLYFDNVENRYFIVEADLWDISKLQYRKYMDAENVERYLALKNELQSILTLFTN